MKDTSGGDIGVFRITVLKDLNPGAWYDSWSCSQCGAVLTLEAMMRPGPGAIFHMEPADGHVRIACPGCGADRLYGINARQVRHVPP